MSNVHLLVQVLMGSRTLSHASMLVPRPPHSPYAQDPGKASNSTVKANICTLGIHDNR